jgi:hypothetical protein
MNNRRTTLTVNNMDCTPAFNFHSLLLLQPFVFVLYFSTRSLFRKSIIARKTFEYRFLYKYKMSNTKFRNNWLLTVGSRYFSWSAIFILIKRCSLRTNLNKFACASFAAFFPFKFTAIFGVFISSCRLLIESIFIVLHCNVRCYLKLFSWLASDGFGPSCR